MGGARLWVRATVHQLRGASNNSAGRQMNEERGPIVKSRAPDMGRDVESGGPNTC